MAMAMATVVAAAAAIARSASARAAIVRRPRPSISGHAATIATPRRAIAPTTIVRAPARRRANAPTARARPPTGPTRRARKATAHSAARRAAAVASAVVVVVAAVAAAALPKGYSAPGRLLQEAGPQPQQRKVGERHEGRAHAIDRKARRAVPQSVARWTEPARHELEGCAEQHAD